ncbi:lactate dehydrogenase [Funiculus sociatus GB2-A5]|uniref:site-specific DNA-methyltransferase (adenine-specific) n=1 Tax=Funiculus sociatus GB2-A5 TaxID=2933946 RepID=A0ABV0JV64_9CYAN|nr:class I SAM-dependent DNA methyltransferase [Trichocoleus sp. FACHB-6]MBD2060752.1 class I SAM-dependent DNA methyltransferase [Trichocoleus sp. FACHB-6]
MNAVEIEEAVSMLAEAPFDSVEFPFTFLEAFGNKPTTIKRLKSGNSNQSDLPGAVLQRNNIHLKICAEGEVTATLTALRESAATARQKVKFILATDGKSFEAENLVDGETIACDYPDFPDHFGFFLPLAGITTVRQIRENAFDIKATGRLNRLYIELLKENPDWDTAERREEMNHFMARLIFCFFAEDTNIFHKEGLFTQTVAQMSASDSSNTHEVLSDIFRAMCTPLARRESAKIRSWANVFPYVNGGLFAGGVEVPRFSKIARSYLLHVGSLDWTKINPDIFGSMIQAVADDEERGSLGMHYTSVPNILKVLNPLFLDDLRAQLEAAEDNARKLLNLRQRMSRIRVFDPACGSGNFLVIAYKEMRAIEAEINRRRGEPDRKSDIPLTNFRGIEIRHFSCEVARLALIIAEYQCDVLYRGLRLALAEFLPLKADNWITCGNALRLDWLSICPPTGTGVKLVADDLFSTPLEQTEIDFENEGGETYICGNPPYLGSTWQSKEQKGEIRDVVNGRTNSPGFLDYVSGWFIKAADWLQHSSGRAAFVSTNSICQGQMVPLLWPIIWEADCEILFAHTSFKWSNLASNNAGVTVAIVCIARTSNNPKALFEIDERKEASVRLGSAITPYLTLGKFVIVKKLAEPVSGHAVMEFGNKPSDGGNLLVAREEVNSLGLSTEQKKRFLRTIVGSEDFINGNSRYCIWIEDSHLEEALSIATIAARVELVRQIRLASPDKGANALAKRSHQLKLMRIGKQHSIVVPAVSSERRAYLPVGLVGKNTTVTNAAFALFDAPLWNMALIASRLHLVWVSTVCGKLETRIRYSNTLGWNTFPVPTLTEQNKADLTHCAEEILLAREHYFPATIADMYDPDRMDNEFPLVRQTHDHNDEVLERIYIGRRFKNDTERLEKLFELYTKMTSQQALSKKPAKRKAKGSTR